MNVLVGLSGGVDSAVTAALLKTKGYDVIGVTMAIWGDKKATVHPSTHGACLGPDEKNDIETARRIAKYLDIPFYVIDCSKKYDEIVLNYFKNEYLSGRTPNPCIRCNSLIKFGILPIIAKEQGIEFDKFATGHYAKIIEKDGVYYLAQGTDKSKDQSYFLYKLTQNQLKDSLLPLGEYSKSEVRELAEKLDTTILASGPIDILSDGKTTIAIDNGDDMMPLITGSGCMLSSIVGSCIGGSTPLEGSLVAILAMNLAGEKARAKVDEKDEGTGSFRAYLIDYLYKTNAESLINESNIRILWIR